MKKVILVSAVNLILIVSQLALAIGRSAEGIAVSTANARLTQLWAENARLAEGIYTKSAVAYVASQASQLGLVPGQVRWLGSPASVALR